MMGGGQLDHLERVRGALAAVQRRHVAALRLPPLPCGCHDPLMPAHMRGECQGDRGESR